MLLNLVTELCLFFLFVSDVTLGAFIGILVSYTCYRQVYPALNKINSHLCYTHITPVFEAAVAPVKPNPHVEPHTPPSPSEFVLISKDL
jgi:hypothetical protein